MGREEVIGRHEVLRRLHILYLFLSLERSQLVAKCDLADGLRFSRLNETLHHN
jgi:hypothetical protein